MNEPQVYYSPEGLREAEDVTRNLSQKDLGNTRSHELRAAFHSCFDTAKYFDDFYHQPDADSPPVCHRDVHNLYAMKMVQAAAEALQRLLPDKRYFLISRSAFAGSHRYGGMWTGDNHSWWEHMLSHIRMMLSLNMSGMFYCGADIGGHIGAASPELVIRWMQLGAFTPLYRNHSDKHARSKEPWAFDENTTSILRNVIRLRYAFLPYAYSEFLHAREALEPFVSPLFLHFDSERCREIEDQYLYGRSVMVAPLCTPNARGRFVHLPETHWLRWTASCCENRNMEVMPPGDYYVSAELSEIPLFLRQNHLIPLSEVQSYVNEKPLEEIRVVGLVTNQAKLKLLHDDGVSYACERGVRSELHIEVQRKGDSFSATARLRSHPEAPLILKQIHFEIYDTSGRLHSWSEELIRSEAS